MKTNTALACLASLLCLLALTSTPTDSPVRVVSGSVLTGITGAQIPPQLVDEKCELIDTSAACDIANAVIGGCVNYGDDCSYCANDEPSNTNESEMCITFDGASCSPSDTGPDNICGDEMEGICIFDPNFNLMCRSAPGDPCGDIKQDGC